MADVILHKCIECGKNFQSTSNLNKHLRTIHKHVVVGPKKTIKCSSCPYECLSAKGLDIHLREVHNIALLVEELQFTNFEEFKKWKETVEKETRTSFVKNCGSKRSQSKEVTHYYCNRSGSFESRGNGKRHLKIQGSSKINTNCPARITATTYGEGHVDVTHHKTHAGHNFDLGHLHLQEEERNNIAEKLHKKIPVNVILDEIRDSVGDSLERGHLLTRRDVLNIQHGFGINCEGKYNANDAESIHAWVKSLSEAGPDSPIIYYKPQGDIDANNPCLLKKDFVLVVMTPGQIKMMELFGSDVVSTDSTHGTNAYDFELTTLLVINDKREGFPAAFIISNRQDEETLTVAFTSIKQVVNIQPEIFMSDDAEAFYNAWKNVFGSVQKRLLCSWHVDQSWRKKLNKLVSGQEQQAEIYKMLRCLLTETDENAFGLMLPQVVKELSMNSSTKAFGKYFHDYYAKRPENWAYCFRKWAGINTNMHIERMHKTIKYMYLEGKKVKRLDRSMYALMKFVRDRQFDRLIAIHKGKISSKIANLRNRHRLSNSLSEELVIASSDEPNMVWSVKSASRDDELYCVERVKECSADCTLICKECNACIHSFKCTCIDNCIQYNMCKHIHLVLRTLNDESSWPIAQSTALDVSDGNLEILHNPLQELQQEEAEAHVEDLRSKNVCLRNSVEESKKQLRITAESLIESCTTSEECQALQKLLTKSSIVLLASKHQGNAAIDFVGQSKRTAAALKEPANKNIEKQRRFFSTRKKAKKSKENVLVHPNREERVQIAGSLILNSHENDFT